MRFAKRVVDDVRAQDLAEYGIALSIIGALVTVISVVIASNVAIIWSTANGIIGAAAS